MKFPLEEGRRGKGGKEGEGGEGGKDSVLDSFFVFPAYQVTKGVW